MFLSFSHWEIKVQTAYILCNQLLYLATNPDLESSTNKANLELLKNDYIELLLEIFNPFENKLILKASFKVKF